MLRISEGGLVGGKGKEEGRISRWVGRTLHIGLVYFYFKTEHPFKVVYLPGKITTTRYYKGGVEGGAREIDKLLELQYNTVFLGHVRYMMIGACQFMASVGENFSILLIPEKQI